MNESSIDGSAASYEVKDHTYEFRVADVFGPLRTSRRIAWIVAWAACLAAAIEALALAVLAPLKTVIPYTIELDQKTGYVRLLKALKPGQLSEVSAATQSLIIQYVIARESFDAADLRENYRKVAMWSAGSARSSFLDDMRKTNPGSPLNLYQPTTIVSTTIDSSVALTPTTALVRFHTDRRDIGGSVAPQGSFVAVLSFRYSGWPMRMEDRVLNPLGFQVISYRRDGNYGAASPPALSSGLDRAPPPGRIGAGTPSIEEASRPVNIPSRPLQAPTRSGDATPLQAGMPHIFIGPMPR